MEGSPQNMTSQYPMTTTTQTDQSPYQTDNDLIPQKGIQDYA